MTESPRVYTNNDGLSVSKHNDVWYAVCRHNEGEQFALKRDAMLAFGARFCETCKAEVQDAIFLDELNEPTFSKCRCGCEENVAPKRHYRPGHDARHAGAVARALIANDSDRAASAARAAMSGALRAKVDKIRRAAK